MLNWNKYDDDDLVKQLKLKVNTMTSSALTYLEERQRRETVETQGMVWHTLILLLIQTSVLVFSLSFPYLLSSYNTNKDFGNNYGR